jgi:hypothetical protein
LINNTLYIVKSRALLLGFCFCITSSAFADWTPSTRALSKAEKTLVSFFERELTKNSISLSPNYYSLTDGDSLVGFLCFQQAPSKHDQFDFMAIYSPNMQLLNVQVLIYRENYGGEIMSKRWLKQFVSRPIDKVQAISGATISVDALKSSVKNLTNKMQNWLQSQP